MKLLAIAIAAFVCRDFILNLRYRGLAMICTYNPQLLF